MSADKKYWKSLEELNQEVSFVEQAHHEFTEPIPVEEFLQEQSENGSSTSRRDFLKFCGFSLAAASLAACETPVTKTIPYVVKPEEVHPGIANWYASTYYDGADYCSILVKTREGRPIHIQGNKLSGVTNGGINARVNSSVLSLYDTSRLKEPRINGQPATWEQLDKEAGAKLQEIAARGGQIRILTNSVISPSSKFALIEFVNTLRASAENTNDAGQDTGADAPSNVQHVTYDAVSYSGMRKANMESFGNPAIPGYRFDKAKVIVSLGADFLTNWLSPIEFAVQYAMNRKPDGDWMSRHFQFETIMSTTGSNSDVRGAIKPSEHGKAALHLYNMVAAKAGGGSVTAGELADDNHVMDKLAQAADELWANKGESLVVAGSNDRSVQSAVNAINFLLGNYGNTIDLDNPSMIRQADDAQVEMLVKEMAGGQVDAIIIGGCDPVSSMPGHWNFAEALGKVNMKIAFADRINETAAKCDFIAANHHYLESWDDANPKHGHYSLAQPVISPLFNTRQWQSTILKWAGKDEDFHAYIQSLWKEYGWQEEMDGDFTAWWNRCLRDGAIYRQMPAPQTGGEAALDFLADMREVAGVINELSDAGDMELEVYMKTGIGEGTQSNNPWLHELPDPVSRVVWDNYITMNPADMKGQFNTSTGQETGASMAKLSVATPGIERSVVLPVVAIPGQKRGTVGVALGYGKHDGRVSEEAGGANMFQWVHFVNDTIHYTDQDVKIEKVEGEHPLASVQTHHTMMGRKIVNETTMDMYKGSSKKEWNKDAPVKDAYGRSKDKITDNNLWADHELHIGHRWGMTIDLNTCIGCGACVTACTSENNVPVVGRDEVRRNREMHWLRIDRYYSSGTSKKENTYKEMEVPDEYPDVVFQPVMCQHCNHAPCETVCPVAATTHSDEGYNQMAYNRCVGTRYCANNCPYKVRRFNWFNYVGYKKFTTVNPSQDDIGRMVLNPDVVVRSRGVMEKCSFCVQRVQESKLQAKKNGTPLEDGSVQTACASACPTNAINFGDYNDEKSTVRKNSEDDRAYHLLEEVGVQPNVWYMTKVRNRSKKQTDA